MSDERKFLTIEEAIAMLPDGIDIHTFTQSGYAWVGADWTREDVISLIKSDTLRELAGPIATNTGHGLVVWQGKEPLFIATKKSEHRDS